MSTDRIANRCPACGRSSLIVRAGGWLVCGFLGCEDPAAIDRLLRGKLQTEYAVRAGGYYAPALETRAEAVKLARENYGEDLVVCERLVGEWAKARDASAIIAEARTEECAGCARTLVPYTVAQRDNEQRPYCWSCVLDALKAWQTAQQEAVDDA